ncbi:MAG: tetratricopeptide repeat protein [Pseudobdellovibrionaceae bacterium]
MSDQHSEKPDDYDAIFGSDEAEAEVIDAETVESRIDDYEDIDDGDEDAGIFANEASASRKKGGISSAIVLLSVATLAFGGVGAYFALSGSEAVAPEVPVVALPVTEKVLAQADTPIPAPAEAPETAPASDLPTGDQVETPEEPAAPVESAAVVNAEQEVPAEMPPMDTGLAENTSEKEVPVEPVQQEMVAIIPPEQVAPDTVPPSPATDKPTVPASEATVPPSGTAPAEIPATETVPTLPPQGQAEIKLAEPIAPDAVPATSATEEATKAMDVPAVSVSETNKATLSPEVTVAEKDSATGDANKDIGVPPVVAADNAVIDVTNGSVPSSDITEARITPTAVPDSGVKASVIDVPNAEVDVPPVTELAKADTAKTGDKKAAVPTPAKKAEKDDIVLDDNPAEENVPKTVYYDAPSGRILGDLPAPSLNLPKNAKESMIVVNSNGGKVTSSKSAVETTDLESKIIAAGRALKLERYDAAKEMYDDLYRLNPKDGRILMGRAVLFQKIGNNDKAIATYEEILNVNPENTEAIVNLTGLIRKQYPAVALNKLLDLKQKFPENPAVLAQLGVAYADSQNYESAIDSLRQAVRFDPRNAKHYFNMAIVAERMNDRKAAINYYEKALEVDAIYGAGRSLSRDVIYDRLTRLRGE